MIHLYNLDDLKLFGINPLTGEADRYCLRILCDLSQRGVDLVCEFFGMQAGGFAENWNSHVGDEPAIASLMLTRDTLWELGRFALLHVEQCDIVVGRTDGMRGMNRDDPYCFGHIEYAQNHDLPVTTNCAKTSRAPGSGSRNEHAFTGRTV